MSYEPTTWVNGDIITATKLNNIESGVQSVSSSYEPTTWVNGDIITAAKLNNIEQGIANAGGGGGSSDFSTATVTVQDNTLGEGGFGFGIIYLDNDDMLSWFTASTYPQTITGVLYNGSQTTSGLEWGTVSVAGNATLSGGEVIITGDCTITIS